MEGAGRLGVVGVELGAVDTDMGVAGVVGVTGEAGMGDMRPLRGTSVEARVEEAIICSMHEGERALSGSSSLSPWTLMSGSARGLARCPTPGPISTLVSHESMAMRCDGGGVTARRLRRCPGTSPYPLVGLGGEAEVVGLTGEASDGGLCTAGGLGLRRGACACAASSSDIAIVMLAIAGSGAE